MGRTGRKPKPARTYMREDDERWIIIDRGKQISTGVSGRGCEQAAQEALERYLARKHFNAPDEPLHGWEVTVDSVLSYYLNNLRPDMSDPQRQADAVKALAPFWSRMMYTAIDKKRCKKYWKTRPSYSTVRRELGVLRAALNMAHEDGLIFSAPKVHLPPKIKNTPIALTRNELARVLWILWRNKRTKHAARFLLCMFHTGSRPGTIARSTWEEQADGPWVDLVFEIWWRAGANEPETVKRRGPHGIPISLAAHLRRWRRNKKRDVESGKDRGGKYVIEYPFRPNEPVKDIGGSLARACELAGVRRVTPHVLKHSAITAGIKSGMSLTQAVDYFSTSSQTIEGVYWSRSPHHQERAREIMNRPGKPQ